ncbi:Hemolysin, chromosomal [Shimwellia blattae]|uniref:retention module-containing protein n=1 Tax=Shimwellia blattae TaxID=563 RepID=UPI000F708A0F|nr:retention module-containing protein [Shimwellia blattae]VEC25258.1 Hemolysin, chromosomal [Shimwellia blattae]
MSTVIGTIKSMVGQVWIVASDGTRRQATEGEQVLRGEQVVTDQGSATVALANGKSLDIGRLSNWGDNSAVTATPEAAAPQDIAAVQQAIAEGADPTQVLEATAAGNSPVTNPLPGEAGDGGGGHTHVVLDLTGQILDPTAGYPTEGIDIAFPPPPQEETLLQPESDSYSDGGDEPPIIIPPSASITIDPIAGDNIINMHEAGAEKTRVTGSTGLDVKPGDIVTVTVNGNEYTTTVGDDGNWSVEVNTSDLLASGDVNASVTTRDEYGNEATGTADSHVGQATLEVDITINPITGDDNYLNTEELAAITREDGTVELSGTVSGDAKAGDVITVTVNGQTFDTVVGADGSSWTVQVDAGVLHEGSNDVKADITISDTAGNEVSASDHIDFVMDSVNPEVTITIDVIAGDDVLNAAESREALEISGRVSSENPDDPVVTWSDVTLVFTDGSGNEVHRVTGVSVGENSSWSTTLPPEVVEKLATGEWSVTAEVTGYDAAGNPATDDDVRPVTVDTVAPEVTITIDVIAGDDVLNAAESREALEISGRVSSENPDDPVVTWSDVTLVFTDGSGNEVHRVTGVSVGENSSWSTTLPPEVVEKLATGEWSVTAEVTGYDAAGNPATDDDVRPVTVDTVAPEVTITIDVIAGDDVLNAAESREALEISGRVSSENPDDPVVTWSDVTLVFTDGSGNEVHRVTGVSVGENSSWSTTLPPEVVEKLATGEWSVTAEVTGYDAAGNPATDDDVRPVTVDTVAPEVTITIDVIAGDDVLNAAESREALEISGRVSSENPDDPVVTWSDVTLVFTDGSGNEVHRVTGVSVGENNSWSTTLPPEVVEKLATGEWSVTAEVTGYDAAGNPATDDDERPVTVDTVAPEVTITIDVIAGDDVLNGAESREELEISGKVSSENPDDPVVTWSDVTLVFTDGSGNEVHRVTGVSVGENNSWSTTLPPEVVEKLATGEWSVTAEVTGYDAAGNPATDDDERPVTVDTVAPEVTITIDVIAGDDVLNAAESREELEISGRVSSENPDDPVVTWSDVTLVFTDGSGNEVHRVTGVSVGENNSWSTTLPPEVVEKLATGEWSVTAEVTGYDAAGNPATDDDERPVTVDTVAPEVTITIDVIAGDDVLNAAESREELEISGKVSSENPDDPVVTWSDVTLVFTDGSGNEVHRVTGVSVGENNSWSTTLPPEVVEKLATGEWSVTAEVTGYDAAGNPATDDDERPVTVDTVAPEVTITIDVIAGDDVLNAAESREELEISGRVSSENPDDPVVTWSDVTLVFTDGSGNEVHRVTGVSVGENNSWSTTLPPEVVEKLATGEWSVTAEVTGYDAAGNPATDDDERPVTVDTVAPEVTITIDVIAGDDVLNAAESREELEISGKVSSENPDDPVVTWSDVTLVFTDGSGNEVHRVTGVSVGENNSWSTTLPPEVVEKLATGEWSVTAEVTGYDAAGNPATDDDERPVTVDTVAPEVTITIDVIAGDDVLNAAESREELEISGKVSSENPDDPVVTWSDVTLVFTDGSGNEVHRVTGVSVGENNSWSTTLPPEVVEKLATGEWSVTAEVTGYDAAGNPATDDDERPVTVDTVAPEVTITIDVIAGDDVLNAAESREELEISGRVSSENPDDPVVTWSDVTLVFTDGSGNEVHRVTGVSVGENNSWSTTLPPEVVEKLATGEWSVTAEVTGYDAAGNPATDDDVRPVTVDTVAPEVTITIDVIAGDDVLNAAESREELEISGRVSSENPDDPVVTWSDVTLVFTDGSGNEVHRVTGVSVGENNSWSTTLPPEVVEKLATGEWSVTAEVTGYDAAGNPATDDDERPVTVDTVAPEVTITIDVIAGDDVLNAAESREELEISGRVSSENPDDPVVTWSDVTLVFTDGSGNEVHRVTGVSVGENNSWSTTLPPEVVEKLATGEWSVTAEVTGYDAAGNPATDDDERPVTVDTVAPEVTITIDVIAGDDVLNAAESREELEISGKVSSENPDDPVVTWSDVTLVFTDGSGNEVHRVTGVSVGENNSWSTTLPPEVVEKLATGEWSVTAEVTGYDAAGNPATDDDERPVAVDTVAPEANIIIDPITGDDVLNFDEIDEPTTTITGKVSGEASVGDIVTLTINGTDYTGKLELVDGELVYKITDVKTSDLLADTNLNIEASVVATDSAGNTTVASTDREYSIEKGGVVEGTHESDNPVTGTTDDSDIVLSDVKGNIIQQGTDYNIAFILDRSGSMNTKANGDRLTPSKQAIVDVVKELIKSNGANSGIVTIGLISFASNAKINLTIKLDDPDALTKLDKALSDINANGGTDYYEAFKSAIKWFESLNNSAENKVYFITDGAPNENTHIDDSEFAKLDVIADVEAIGIGSGVNTNTLDKFDSDGKSQANIDPKDLADAILGKDSLAPPGDDVVNAGAGNDIIFGDITSFTGPDGTTSDLESYIGKQLGLPDGTSPTAAQMHVWLSEHQAEIAELLPQEGGKDTLFGGAGNDLIFGGGGDDLLVGGDGKDALYGGYGNDILIGDGANSLSELADKLGNKSLTAQEIADAIRNDPSILNVLDDSGSNDILNGGAGDDLMFGGGGDDILRGGTGDDILTGGSGSDTFVWLKGDLGNDTITDFNEAEGDKIDLSDLLGDDFDLNHLENYIKVTEVDGNAVMEINTDGQLNNGGSVQVSITVNGASADYISDLLSTPDQTTIIL